jgi:hypothetical protein
MGSSFKDLVARGPTVKMDRNFEKWFESYDFLRKNRLTLNVCMPNLLFFLGRVL